VSRSSAAIRKHLRDLVVGSRDRGGVRTSP
jgi:hypothetical protein